LTASNGYNRTKTVEYNLHGVVGIQLRNASARDVAAVTRQLGPIQAPLAKEPDIVIEFVDQVQLSSPLRYLGVNDSAFTDDAFFVLRSKNKARAMVQIPFAEIGQQCHIVCETGLPAVPLLIPILNLTALNQGILPLHASAFYYRGTGVLTTGWSKGGKTETLLAFMDQGASYIGDEWVYISQDGCYMTGIPEPIRVWDWHLQSMPQYWSTLGQSDKLRLRTLKLLSSSFDRTAANGLVKGTPVGKQMKRVSTLSKQQMHVDLPPHTLFGPGVEAPQAPLDKVIFVASHASPEITTQPMDPVEIARRMVFSLQEERQSFMSHYFKFRFAFPEAHNPLIEQAEEIQRTLLTRMLADKDAYAVYHPYPVAIPSLFDAIQPLLQRHNEAAARQVG
jgi:hypothetical protein